MTQLSEWKLGTGEGELDITESPRVEGNITGLIVKSSVDGTPEEVGKENENKQNLFDSKTSTKFLARVKPSVNNPVWVSFRLKEARAVRSYSLSAANDNPDRDPKNWIFQGSSDGENWTTLDARMGETFSARFQEKVYAFSNETPYLYYKLVITANAGSPNTTQWSEIKNGTGGGQPVNPPPIDPDPPKPADGDVTDLILPASVKGAEGERDGHVMSNLFDGDPSTKWLLGGGRAYMGILSAGGGQNRPLLFPDGGG
ncbi:MAG: discoidin domain-containing protein [Clostridiales bacterium]|nr:discoidin domain-containing protein [Clostridiales bacterium]